MPEKLSSTRLPNFDQTPAGSRRRTDAGEGKLLQLPAAAKVAWDLAGEDVAREFEGLKVLEATYLHRHSAREVVAKEYQGPDGGGVEELVRDGAREAVGAEVEASE